MRTKPAHVFDGFCYREYREEEDGWRVEQPEEFDYPAVSQARAVLEMYDEIKELRKENWKLRQTEKKYQRMLRPYEVAPWMPNLETEETT